MSRSYKISTLYYFYFYKNKKYNISYSGNDTFTLRAEGECFGWRWCNNNWGFVGNFLPGEVL